MLPTLYHRFFSSGSFGSVLNLVRLFFRERSIGRSPRWPYLVWIEYRDCHVWRASMYVIVIQADANAQGEEEEMARWCQGIYTEFSKTIVTVTLLYGPWPTRQPEQQRRSSNENFGGAHDRSRCIGTWFDEQPIGTQSLGRRIVAGYTKLNKHTSVLPGVESATFMQSALLAKIYVSQPRILFMIPSYLSFET